MPGSVTFAEVLTLAMQLPSAEQKQLAETILHHLASGAQPMDFPRPRSWREIRGSVPYPLYGEGA